MESSIIFTVALSKKPEALVLNDGEAKPEALMLNDGESQAGHSPAPPSGATTPVQQSPQLRRSFRGRMHLFTSEATVTGWDLAEVKAERGGVLACRMFAVICCFCHQELQEDVSRLCNIRDERKEIN